MARKMSRRAQGEAALAEESRLMIEGIDVGEPRTFEQQALWWAGM